MERRGSTVAGHVNEQRGFGLGNVNKNESFGLLLKFSNTYKNLVRLIKFNVTRRDSEGK